MGYLKVTPLLFAVSLWLSEGRGYQEQQQFPPGRIQARQAMQRYEKGLSGERPPLPRLIPDWEKTRGDAARLVLLAQQIQAQVQSGPNQIPARLNKDLKEAEKLVKRIRAELF